MRVARVDRTLLYLTAVLAVGGILIFLSASLSLIAKDSGSFGGAVLTQLVLGLGGGTLALYAALKFPLKALRRLAPYAFGASLLLTALVFVPGLGLTVNGATRWLDLGIITFQPSELLKLGYVIFLASILAGGRNRGADLKFGLLPFLGLTGVSGVLLLIQPDTDTALIIAAAGFAMMFAAGMRAREMVGFAVAGVLILALLVFMRPYLLDRVQTFFDPARDPLGSGYQIQQSLIAVGSGGLTGKGFGQSVQKFNYLPEASSDSIFAVFAEEFGFVGSLALIAGFLFFALRGLWVAARAEDVFGGMLTVGIVTLIGAQAFLNIAAMTGMVPVGGLPLPFVSHGGSALLITLLMVGLILSVSKSVRVS